MGADQDSAIKKLNDNAVKDNQKLSLVRNADTINGVARRLLAMHILDFVSGFVCEYLSLRMPPISDDAKQRIDTSIALSKLNSLMKSGYTAW